MASATRAATGTGTSTTTIDNAGPPCTGSPAKPAQPASAAGTHAATANTDVKPPVKPVRTTVFMNPASTMAFELKKAERDRAAGKHLAHPTMREVRAKRHVETQGDYKPGGYARIKEGDLLNHERYEVKKKLGVGHFSVVYLCWDNQDGGYRAIKVIRSAEAYAKAGYKEDQMLTVLQGPQDDRRQYLVSFLDSFEHPNTEEGTFHYCLVFEVLGMSLLEVLRSNQFIGFPLNTAKQVTKQVLLGLSYLHSLSVAHTDIKPENIMLHHDDIDIILNKQLRQELIAQVKKEEYEKLHPGPPKLPRQPYQPKTPGLSAQQIKQMQDIREKVEARKWEITPVLPIKSPTGFMRGMKKLEKEKKTLRVSPAHPGNPTGASEPTTPMNGTPTQAQCQTTPTKQISPPKSGIGISPPPPPPSTIPDSGYRNLSISSKNSTPTPTKCFSPTKKVSPPLLAKAISQLDDSYLMGAPLERFPSRLVFNSPAGSLQPNFDDVTTASLGFQDDQEAEYEARLSSTTASRKNSPMLSIQTLNIFGETTIYPPSSSPESSKLLLSNPSSGGSSAISIRRNGSGTGSSPSSDDWRADSYTSFKPSSYSSSSTGSSSFFLESPERGLDGGIHAQWDKTRTPSNGTSGTNGNLSSSPIATKYGLRKASSTSFDALNQSQSVFRPALIPHALLAPTPPKPTAEERLRIITARDAKATPPKPEPKPFNPDVRVKIADLGNAIFFTEAKSAGKLPQFVCTRYYREPGNVFGAEYDLGIDVWALGCTLFELLTGDLLFNPESKRPKWSKEDDLLAQQIELLGPFPVDFCWSGVRSWRFFDNQGRLKKVNTKGWGLLDVMLDKYKMPMDKAKPFTDFMLRMLQPDRSLRATVDELLEDPWLDELEEDDKYVLYKHICGVHCCRPGAQPV